MQKFCIWKQDDTRLAHPWVVSLVRYDTDYGDQPPDNGYPLCFSTWHEAIGHVGYVLNLQERSRLTSWTLP